MFDDIPFPIPHGMVQLQRTTQEHQWKASGGCLHGVARWKTSMMSDGFWKNMYIQPIYIYIYI